MADDTRTGIMTEEFFRALAAALKLAVTPRLRGFLTTWPRYEGVPVWIWNPLATTQLGHRSTRDIGYGPGKWNTANPPYGVGIYADLDAGAAATAATITNGYYPELVQTLLRGGVIGDRQKLVAEINTWGTSGFASLINSGWEAPLVNGPDPEPVPAGTNTDVVKRLAALETRVADLEKLNPALQDRMSLMTIANDADSDYVREAVRILSANGYTTHLGEAR